MRRYGEAIVIASVFATIGLIFGFTCGLAQSKPSAEVAVRANGSVDWREHAKPAINHIPWTLAGKWKRT